MIKEEREARIFIRAAIQNDCDKPMASRLIRKMVQAVREDCAKVAYEEATLHHSGSAKWDLNLAENIAAAIRGKK